MWTNSKALTEEHRELRRSPQRQHAGRKNPGCGRQITFERLEDALMWRCTICGYIYDDTKEGTKFEDLPDDWNCPVCNAPKDAFVRI